MNSGSWLLAQNGGNAEAAVGGIIFVMFMLFWLALTIVIIASMWKVFEKAGKPGWASLVPIYNTIVLIEITGRPVWWFLLLMIPCVNVVIAVMLMIDLAKSFGKDPAFGIGLALLGIVFFPMLAFSNARYIGPVAS